jgi:hypothetical protein
MQNLDSRQGEISTQIFLPPQFKNYDPTLMATRSCHGTENKKLQPKEQAMPLLFSKYTHNCIRHAPDEENSQYTPYYARDSKSAPPSKTNGK